MPFPIVVGLAELALILLSTGAVDIYNSNQQDSYPPGYETSYTPVWPTIQKQTYSTNKDTYPLFQDPLIFYNILKEIETKNIPLSKKADVIDETMNDDIEPDTPEDIAKFEKEIEYFRTYTLGYYEKELDKVRNGQSSQYSEKDLERLMRDCESELAEMELNLAILKGGLSTGLTEDEKDTVRGLLAERMVKIKEEQRDKIKTCGCSIAPFIIPKTLRRNMSDLSADYQATISGAKWQRSKNPETGKMSVEISEWIYDGPLKIKVDFDGWMPNYCLLLEMKANYDTLMFSKTKKNYLGKPKLKKIGEGKMEVLMKQAERHNKVCLEHPPARCCWIFMTPFLHDEFLVKLAMLPAITAVHVPTKLPKT